ncbi:MAG: carboxymuconolactone decarboxylase family protein [Pseudomonadota bacterium]
MTTTDDARAMAERLNPGVEPALEARYGHLVPGLAETVVDFAFGRVYDREGLDLRARMIATVAGLTVLGGQTRPQLKVNIAAAVRAGVERREIAETIWQMSLYGGLPAAINGLNAMLEVFEEMDAGDGS